MIDKKYIQEYSSEEIILSFFREYESYCDPWITNPDLLILRKKISEESFENMRYFILDLNIPYSDDIKNKLLKTNGTEIINLFNLRELNKNLNNELKENNPIIKKIKL